MGRTFCDHLGQGQVLGLEARVESYLELKVFKPNQALCLVGGALKEEVLGFGQAWQVLASSVSLWRAYLPVSSLISRQPNLSLANNFRWMNDSGLVKEELYKGSKLWHIL